jgi:YggT family protein
MVLQIVWGILALLEILLGLRFLLKLMAANPDAGFATFIYGITGPFVAPFEALVGTPATGGVILELTTLIAMAIYALIFWGAVYVIGIVVNRPRGRTVTRSTREQTGAGSERTTHTTQSG